MLSMHATVLNVTPDANWMLVCTYCNCFTCCLSVNARGATARTVTHLLSLAAVVLAPRALLESAKAIVMLIGGEKYRICYRAGGAS